MTRTNPIPITIITGFLGSGKTTLLLNLLPQLRASNPSYRLALLKNEFGDVAIDSQLASSSSIAGVRELLNGCICCNLVGQLGDALRELSDTDAPPDRIVVETSGSAFPATLAMEVNRVARETRGGFVLDGVVTVIDVENWAGYEDTSYTARVQAKYTDLVVFNKWEMCDERRFDTCLDRLGDLETQIAWVKSDRGRVPADLVFGVDGALARSLEDEDAHAHGHGHPHEHDSEHKSEVEVLSITLQAETPSAAVDNAQLERLLKAAPKDEVYRIKAVLASSSPLASSDADTSETLLAPSPSGRYILNWAFGRWTCTPMRTTTDGEHESSSGLALRMTMILARYESSKWKKKLETLGFLALESGGKGTLVVKKVS